MTTPPTMPSPPIHRLRARPVVDAQVQAKPSIHPMSEELALAAACCHWPPSADGARRVRAAAAEVRNWERFDTVVCRNRITPLVQRALARAEVDLPDGLAERLSTRSFAAARRALAMARESVRLQQAFDADGIASMVVKGSPLAMLAYGELGVKESVDIDLLVGPDTLAVARRLLLDLGYQMRPPMTEDEFVRFAEHDKEAIFYLGGSGIKVELHWRLVTPRQFLRGVDVRGPAQSVSFSGGVLRTLADEPLFAFLCLHGAFHNWSRLKWLADVGAFIGTRSQDEVEHLYAAATAFGAGRSATTAMLLCRRLFGLPLGDALLRSLQQDRIAPALANNVVAGLSYRQGVAEHGAYSMPWLRMKAARFFLEPGASHLIDQARVAWISPADRAQIALPGHLAFLYHFIRIPLWFLRSGQRVVRAWRG